MKLKWTKGARADLLDIVLHISMDRPEAARKMAKQIRGSTEFLRDQPELGRVVPELGDVSIRERVVRPYRVIYRLTAKQVEVLAVVHSRRLLANVVEE